MGSQNKGGCVGTLVAMWGKQEI